MINTSDLTKLYTIVKETRKYAVQIKKKMNITVFCIFIFFLLNLLCEIV